MNAIFAAALSSAWLESLGHIALKGAALLTLALLAGASLRRVSAARRYVLWFSALLALGVVTIAAPLLPAWRVLPAREKPTIEAPAPEEEVTLAEEEPLPMSTLAPTQPPIATTELATIPKLPPTIRWPIFSWSDVVTILPTLWLVIAIGLGVRLVISSVRLSRLRRRCSNVEIPSRLNEVLSELTTASDKTAPKLIIGPADSIPMVWGIIQPCLMLPADAVEWSEEKLRAVLLHELEHLQRRDPVALLVAQVAQALHWFNPLAWLTVRSLRADQERACDDAVLRHGVRASDYAQHLLDLSQHSRLAPGLGLCALAMAQSAPVEKRLAAILDPRIKRDASSRTTVFAALVIALSIAAPLAMLANEAAKGLRGRILDRHGVVLAASTQEKVRKYPLKTLAAHVIGYTGNSGPEDPTPEGRAAMEKQQDAALKKGKDVALSLDARIQALTTRAVKESGFERAAVVVLDPRTGEILASVSMPSYDPNRFIPTIMKEDWEVYVKDKSLPLFDRCLRGQYCPGSAFMPFTALAGIAAGLGERQFDCTGSVEYGGRSYQCWSGRQNSTGHGTLDTKSAIVASCNCYWYQFGNAAGPDAFVKMGRLIGIGEAASVIHDEAKGELPSPPALAAKSGALGKWTAGHTANLAIGQGNLLTTPLQLAVLAATVGNAGKVPKATLLRLEPDARPEWRADLIRDGLPSKQIEQIREGMRLVVNGESGNAKAAHSERCVIAGKTGTTQFLRRGSKDNHCWFIGFAPFDKPTLAFAVLVEGGKSGGGDAAPIAKRVVEETLALPADGSGKVEQAGQIESTEEKVREAAPAPKSDSAAKLYSALLQNEKTKDLVAESKALLAEQPENSVRKLIAGFAHWRNGDTKAAAGSCQKINCNDLSQGQQAIFARIANDAGFKDAALTVVKGIPVDALLMKSEAEMIAPIRPDAPQRQTLAGATLRVVHQSGRAVEVKGPGAVPLRITTSADARGLRLVEVRNLPDFVNVVAVVAHGHETTELRFGKTKGIATDEATILFDGNATPAPHMPANQWRGTIDGHLEIYHSGTRKREELDGSAQLSGADGELRLERKNLNESSNDQPRKPPAEATNTTTPPTVAAAASISHWQIIQHEGRDHVTLENVKTFYRFDSLRRDGGSVILTSRAVLFQAKVGSRDVQFNGVKFVMSDPVVELEGKPGISQLDLVRLIDPVLRPSYIKDAAAFDTVVIDPGHGGNDEGAKSNHGMEKDMTLKLGMNLKAALEKRGFKVVMTRSADEFKTLASRVKVANDTPNSILISLHFNSGGANTKGVETFALTPQADTDPALNSQNIALAAAIHARVVTRLKLEDRGVKRAAWRILSGCSRPGIQFEGGFMTNDGDGLLIASETYRKALAKNMADAVVTYQKAVRASAPAKKGNSKGASGKVEPVAKEEIRKADPTDPDKKPMTPDKSMDEQLRPHRQQTRDPLLLFLEKPQQNPARFHVRIRRTHYFDDDVPGPDSKNAFEIQPMTIPPNQGYSDFVFALKSNPPAVNLDTLLPWSATASEADVTLKWHEEQGKKWVEMIELQDLKQSADSPNKAAKPKGTKDLSADTARRPLDDALREGGKLGENAIPAQMPSDQIFEDDSDHFNDRAKLILMKLGFLIEKNPGTLFVITCYTDSVGDNQANLELSQRRADAVAMWLRQNLHLTTQRIKAVGMGDKELIETNAGADKEALRVNQRLEIKVRTIQVDPKAGAQTSGFSSNPRDDSTERHL